MKYFSILLLLLVSCKSQKIIIDDNPNVVVKEAFYKVTPAAIKEGNTYININFVADISLTSKKIEMFGVYFKEDYTLIKKNSKNQYIGSVIQSEKMKDFPFKLKLNEFVLKYKEGNKIKYGLFKIKKEEIMDNIPM